MAQQTVLIFHCEFSERRAPFMYGLLREWDRRGNVESYPRLWFPEIYVMQGGYFAFWKKYHGTKSVMMPTSTSGAGSHKNNSLRNQERHTGYVRQANAYDISAAP